MTTWHPSYDDPQPAYLKHCPVCGATVHPLHVTGEYRWPLRPDEALVWHWTARCWNGHLVEALPEQLVLLGDV